jgi:hypothetical protein
MSRSILLSLSFAQQAGGRIRMWSEAGLTGDPVADSQVGVSRAAELVEYMRVNQAPMVLGHVVRAIIERGEIGAVETGFLHGLSDALAERRQEEVDNRPAGKLRLRLAGGTDLVG